MIKETKTASFHICFLFEQQKQEKVNQEMWNPPPLPIYQSFDLKKVSENLMKIDYCSIWIMTP